MVIPDKKLRRRSRAELLEMLLTETQRSNDMEKELTAWQENYEKTVIEDHELLQETIDAYEEQIRALKEKHEEQLADRQVIIKESGSLAEVCMRLNGVFEASEQACLQYVDNIRLLSENADELCRQKLAEADETCGKLIEEAQEKHDRIVREARDKSQAYWDEVYERLEEYRKQYAELNHLFEDGE